MGDLIALSSKEEVSEMIPSFCFYYKEILYCQNIAIRIEANNGFALCRLIIRSVTTDWTSVRKKHRSFR